MKQQSVAFQSQTKEQAMKRFCLALAVALAVAGCNGSGSDASPTTTTQLDVPTTTVVLTTTTTSTTTTTTTTTTTVAPEPTTPPSTVPEVVIPEGAPSKDEVFAIVNEWGVRLRDVYAEPNSRNVDLVCLAGSACETHFGAQIQELRDTGQRVVGAEPPTVNFLRAVSALDGGGFAVSYWTNPTIRGRLVGPDGDRAIQNSSVGYGETLVFVPFPDDPDFGWRVTDFTPDP